jgi:hypothetical protein
VLRNDRINSVVGVQGFEEHERTSTFEEAPTMQTFTKPSPDALLTPENYTLLLTNHRPSRLANPNLSAEESALEIRCSVVLEPDYPQNFSGCTGYANIPHLTEILDANGLQGSVRVPPGTYFQGEQSMSETSGMTIVNGVKEYNYFANGEWRAAEGKKLFGIYCPYSRMSSRSTRTAVSANTPSELAANVLCDSTPKETRK